jgi:putative molybdopterin biosynthesis protein
MNQGKKEQPSEWLTTKEVARFLQLNPRTIQKMVKQKQLPASRIGRALRIRKSDIDAFMNEHQVKD